MTTLPTDVFDCVAKHIVSQKVLSVLCRCNRAWNEIAIPHLYYSLKFSVHEAHTFVEITHQNGPPENTMQRYMTVHVTCQNHVGYMTFNISDMHFDMSEHFEHVVCHDSTCNLPCSTTNEDVFAP